MAEKPVIFTENIDKIIAGIKTQTRRVLKPQPVIDAEGMWDWKDCQWMDGGLGFPVSGVEDHAACLPGDVLWVCEDCDMPRSAARLFLRVTNVRVERLQEVNVYDIFSEGAAPIHEKNADYKYLLSEYWIPMWNSLNANRGYGWDTNPWVWVYDFERIDSYEQGQ